MRQIQIIIKFDFNKEVEWLFRADESNENIRVIRGDDKIIIFQKNQIKEKHTKYIIDRDRKD